MTDKYQDIRDNVTRILAAANVAFTVRYVGETERPSGDKPWKCDVWRFTFVKPEDVGRLPHKYEGDYFTGLGHRKPIPGAPKDKGNPNTLYREDWEKRYLKPVAPPAADILHSLILDAGAEAMNFRDWASDYGYSDDSISALETYRTCCNIGAELRRIFGRETVEALRAATEEL
jgi:hypothetical protein